MHDSTVTAKGQTTLPRGIRDALMLRPGDKVRYFLLDNGEVRLARSGPIAALEGLLRHHTTRRVSLQDMERAIADGAVGD